MPILSAAGNTPYPEDTKFQPITTLNGNDVPDYGLDFDIPVGYRGDKFAFDSCTDPSLLVPKNTIEEDFLNCRYERLFKYKLKTATLVYYLVPWMGVPATKTSAQDWQPLANLYTLNVKPIRFTKELRESDVNSKKRTLRLVPSNANTTAIWLSQSNSTNPDTLVVPDITTFENQSIRIDIPGGAHNETGEYIEIKEVLPDGSFDKRVGKLRILFLEMLTQKVFLIKVTEDNTNFIFNRLLLASDAPLAIDSDVGATHANVVQDTNDFGFKQIGISLVVEGTDSDPCEDVGANDPTMFFDDDDFPIPFKIKKTDIVGSATTVSTDPDFIKFVETFFDRVKYIRDHTGNKLSKYSSTYVFFTPFIFVNNPGASFDSRRLRSTGERSKSSLKHLKDLPSNVSFFIWNSVIAAGTSQTRSSTFTHEGAHALFVNHYFSKEGNPVTPPATGTPTVVKYDEDFINANIWMHLYLKDKYVVDMASTYDSNKVKIEDFKTTPNSKRTLFDEIIDQGMGPAIESFIDSNIFAGNTKPDAWQESNLKKAGADMPISDLVIWGSLNDLVKFLLYQTQNIMDYRAEGVEVLTNAQDNTVYIQRRIVHFSVGTREESRKASQHSDF